MIKISSLEYIPLTFLHVKIWLLWEITMFALHWSKIPKQIDCGISSSHNVKKNILLLLSVNGESVTTTVSEILRFKKNWLTFNSYNIAKNQHFRASSVNNSKTNRPWKFSSTWDTGVYLIFILCERQVCNISGFRVIDV